MKKVLSLLMFCAVTMFAYAHQIWLETKTSATLGSRHEVKIYFGEMNSITPVAKWFSNLRDIEVQLISPSGKITKLDKEAQENYYSAYFTADEKGVYKVSVNHLVKDSFKGMKIRYQSVGYVATETSGKKITLGDKDFLQLELSPKAGNYSYKMLKNKAMKGTNKAEVALKDGTESSIKLAKNGAFTYEPTTKDSYAIALVCKIPIKEVYNEKEVTWDYNILTYATGGELIQ